MIIYKCLCCEKMWRTTNKIVCPFCNSENVEIVEFVLFDNWEVNMDVTFKVRGTYSDRAVACFVEMTLGTGGPLAWDDDDNGAPFFVDDKWVLHSNDFWLRKIDEQPPDEESEKRRDDDSAHHRT